MSNEQQQEQFVGVREGVAATYLAKPRQARHSREGGSPVLFRKAPLSEFIRPRREKAQPSAFPDLPYIGMEHVESHSMRLLGTVPSVSMKSTANRFYAGDVLYGRLRPYLNKVYRTDFDGLCSPEFIVLPKTIGIEPDFLRYRLNSRDFVSFATHLNAGDRPRVDFDQIALFEIAVPALDEQRRIVVELETQLTRLDASVTALKRVQANLKRYRASVLKAACEGRLVPTEAELARSEGRTYESAADLLSRVLKKREAGCGRREYKEPALPIIEHVPPLAEGWTLASLEQLTSAARVICYGILMPKDDVVDGVLYVKVRDLKGDRINVNTLQRTSHEIAAQYARASLIAGDILLAIRGTYGRVVEVPKELEGGNITQDTARVAVNELVDRKYITWFLRSDDAQTYFKRVARGVAVKGVNIGDVRPCPILLPPLAEQHRIVAEVERRLSVIEELEATVAANLKRAERLRQSVLAGAFSS